MSGLPNQDVCFGEGFGKVVILHLFSCGDYFRKKDGFVFLFWFHFNAVSLVNLYYEAFALSDASGPAPGVLGAGTGCWQAGSRSVAEVPLQCCWL